MVSRVAVGGFALMVSTAGPFAADMPMKVRRAPVVPRYDWTGFYIEAEGGFPPFSPKSFARPN